MPEVIEAFNIAESLNDSIKMDKPVISKITIFPKMKISNVNSLELEGTKTVRVFSRGKKVIFNQVTQHGNEIFLVFSLAMTGLFMDKEGKHSKMHFEYKNGHNIWFDDSRGFGSVIVTEDFQTTMSELIGPDLYQDAVSYEEWELVFLEAGQRMIIARFFEEQRYFAGVGNYLLSEILYDAKVMADRKLNTITNEERRSLYESTISVIKKAGDARGLTISDYRDFRGEIGTYKPKVYGIKGSNVDGYKVLNKKVNGRTFWYVPGVQK
jgi:formamidopyrimidine-DNA glycosylase